MSVSNLRWSLCVAWVALAVFTFAALDASEVRSWIYLGVVGTVPPCVLLRRWHQELTLSVATILRGPEGRP
jgi:hypothetical protein